jgi:purine-binding chemotaxis protein CheW
MTEARVAWQEVYARLAQARQHLAASSGLPAEEVQRILRERAQRFALSRSAVQSPTDVLELVVFTLAGERYSIEVGYVREVTAVRDLIPVPCTPPCILGVMNHRGRILPILDCRRLFALATREVTTDSRIVAVEAGGMTFGILADALLGAIRVGAHEIMSPPAVLRHDHQALLRGVTGEMIAVLDLEALAQDPRIMVNDEVG